MLAKTWKTILLAICIIAVLFNIISKLVRTPSFQRNLDAVIEEPSQITLQKEALIAHRDEVLAQQDEIKLTLK